MKDTLQPEGPVETVKTVLRILEGLKVTDGATVAELADQLGIAKSTVHRHLTTLERSKYVVKRQGRYELGFRFLDFGQFVRMNTELYDLAKPRIEEIADNTGQAAWCVIEEHDYAVYLARAKVPKAVQTHARVGKWEYLHTIAAGKAILANLPEHRVSKIIDEVGLPARTPDTITDPDTLLDELETIREKGVAFNDGERVPNVRAVAVPILHDGRSVGSISVAGPKNRLTDEFYREEIPKELLGTANEIELQLTYS